MNRNVLFSGLLAFGGAAGVLAQKTAEACGLPPRVDATVTAPEPRAVDLAICLDTSGSMSGLIEAAKQKLWAIVNDLALAKPAPRLRVALLTFGNDGHNPEDGWVAVQTPFTDDLDLVSQRLFALSTNGGTEYVGRVLQYAGQLDWHAGDDGLKLAVVAGNESADQDGEVPFREMCKALISRGIMINSIYCGPASDNIAPGWREVALLADGKFAAIDQNHGTIVVESPFDDQLAALSAAVNETYVPFGAEGERGLSNQTAQDTNASGLNSAAAATRAQTKASALYNCAWDLVDACRSGQVDLAELETEALPEAMKGMSAEQRAAYIEQMQQRRTEIQKQIAQLSEKREAFVRQEMKKQSADDSKSFDSAIRKAVREQAEQKGLRFEES